MEPQLAVAVKSTPVGKNTGITYDFETGKMMMISEIKKQKC
jgi:hypothetical protein